MNHVCDNRLTVDGKVICFPNKIWKVVKIAGVYVVLLDLPRKEESIENIYGVRDGNIIWQVQALREYNPLFADPLVHQWLPYTGIAPYDKNSQLIIATCWDGFCYVIDPRNGIIIKEDGWVK